MQISNQDPNQVTYNYKMLLSICAVLSSTGQIPFVGHTDTKLIWSRTTSFTTSFIWPVLLTARNASRV